MHTMQYVSFLGLVVLLLLAYGMSFDHWNVRFKSIGWGLVLQLIFAMIILKKDATSFWGMGLFGLLLLAYVWSDERSGRIVTSRALGIMALGVAASAGLVFLPVNLPWIAILASLFALAVLNVFLIHHAAAGRVLATLLIVGGVTGAIDQAWYGQTMFGTFTDGVTSFLNLSDFGSRFLFGNLASPEHYFPAAGAGWPGFGFQFAFKVLPTIVFFGGFMGILYYLGVMQRIMVAIARFMQWTMGTSGAETLSCAANIFVGQTEAPLLVKPFLAEMTRSELCAVMVGGFATIAGGVLAGYVAMGVDAGHLIAASVMSAPASLVVAKLILPETEVSRTAGNVEVPPIQDAENVIDAATVGISDGLKLAVNVGAMLLGFIALIAVVDVVLNHLDYWIDGRFLKGAHVNYLGDTSSSPATGEYLGIFPGSLQTLFGTLFRPLAWVMGVPWADAGKVGNLLGIRLSLNEFVAYKVLTDYLQTHQLSPRAEVISIYALCGFANFSSIGIQIGGIGAMVPHRRRDLSRIGMRAMLGGTIASLITAAIAGLFLAD